MSTRRHWLFRYVIPCVVAGAFLFPLVGALAQLAKGHAKFFQLKCAPLEGFGQKSAPSALTAQTWLNSTFQKDCEEWFTSNFGARSLLVRVNNELTYSLFGRNYMNGGRILADERQRLYEEGYVRDYYHRCTKEEGAKVAALAADLAELQRLLRRRGIAFVYVVTPSKAVIQPSRFAGPSPEPARHRVYHELVAQLKAHDVNFVDGHRITARLQHNSCPTFPRGGIHWMEIAAVPTFNEVLKSVNSQLGRHAFSTISVAKTFVDKPDRVESDLAGLMNLLKPRTDYQCFHGDFTLVEPAVKNRSTLVLEGCSFCGQLTAIADKTQLCKSMRHYFYFTRALHSWPDGRHLENFDAGAVDWERDVFTADAIVVENNEALFFDHNQKFARAAINKLKEGSKLAEARRAL